MTLWVYEILVVWVYIKVLIFYVLATSLNREMQSDVEEKTDVS